MILDEVWTKAQACGCACHPNKYSRGTSFKAWGCPRNSLLHQQKYQVIFQDTIFLLLHMLCVFLGASLFLLLVFFCFVCCNKCLDPNMFLLEKTHSIFIAKNTLVRILIVLRVFSFSSTAFSFCFSHFYFCSELVSSL
jgi:hypothetical protein